MTQRPPRLAVWLLRRFIPETVCESLIGDLVEQHERRRSMLWFWRQVISTIVVQIVSDVRARKLAAVGVVAAGFAVWMMLERLVWPLFITPMGVVWIFGRWVSVGPIIQWISWCWLFIEGLMIAWFIGVLFRSRRVSM